MVERSISRMGVGRPRALVDGGRRTNGRFYFFLELPAYLRVFVQHWSILYVSKKTFLQIQRYYFHLTL